MYEVKSKIRKIKGVEVETWEREIIDTNILSVEAGTNGYQGGDTGHGCRTYIRISDEGSTDIHAKVIENRYGDTMGIEISLGGDAELATIIEALKFITKVLEEGQEAALSKSILYAKSHPTHFIQGGTKMKKTLILMLTLCLAGMLTACGTSSAQPANTPLTDTLSESATGNPQTEQSIVASDLKPSEGLEFESNGDDTCTLVGIGICKDADLVIPTKSPDGETLTVIEEDAFMGLEDVSSVTLLNGNYEVEDRAFQYNDKLTSVIVGSGTVETGEYLFSGCPDGLSVSIAGKNYMALA